MSRRNANTTKVFVGSLPGGVTPDDLRGLFAPYGKIVECDIANRCGFLHLEDKDLATKAIDELNNTNFMGGRISVEKGRVKPPRRGREGGGPMRGGGRGGERGAPYAREDAYGRGPPRNGMGAYGAPRTDYPPQYGAERYGEYDRGMQAPRSAYGMEYGDAMADRRPMFDERRGGGAGGYMTDRRAYAPNNGYDRRGYDDRAGGYGDERVGYDDRRLPPGPGGPVQGGYEDSYSMMSDQRPMMDQQRGGSMTGYDRGNATDLFSRRNDALPKPMMAGGGVYDRDMTGGYAASSSVAGAYSTGAGTDAAYSTGVVGAYGAPTAAAYGSAAPTGGYGDSRAPAPVGYATNGPAPTVGYGTTADSYGSAAGGYGDAYSASRVAGSYETPSYGMTPQRSFTSPTGGPGPRRDIPGPGRRY